MSQDAVGVSIDGKLEGSMLACFEPIHWLISDKLFKVRYILRQDDSEWRRL